MKFQIQKATGYSALWLSVRGVVMQSSRSQLFINWLPPVLIDERWEFFHHPAKQPWYQRNGVGWDHLAASFVDGSLVAYPRGDRIGTVVVDQSFSRFEDYQHYLAKARRNYRKSYSSLENDLQRAGSLTLNAPIVLSSGTDALLFSGYRRLCLAWNYGMVPYVWLVKLDTSTYTTHKE